MEDLFDLERYGKKKNMEGPKTLVHGHTLQTKTEKEIIQWAANPNNVSVITFPEFAKKNI